MSQDEMTDSLSEAKRKEIFQRWSRPRTRKCRSPNPIKRSPSSSASSAQLRNIEREGLDNQWPPL